MVLTGELAECNYAAKHLAIFNKREKCAHAYKYVRAGCFEMVFIKLTHSREIKQIKNIVLSGAFISSWKKQTNFK